jgi:hypothetical protein
LSCSLENRKRISTRIFKRRYLTGLNYPTQVIYSTHSTQPAAANSQPPVGRSGELYELADRVPLLLSRGSFPHNAETPGGYLGSGELSRPAPGSPSVGKYLNELSIADCSDHGTPRRYDDRRIRNRLEVDLASRLILCAPATDTSLRWARAEYASASLRTGGGMDDTRSYCIRPRSAVIARETPRRRSRQADSEQVYGSFTSALRVRGITKGEGI